MLLLVVPTVMAGGPDVDRRQWHIQEQPCDVPVVPRLPDLGRYTEETVRDRIPRTGKAVITLERMGRNHLELEDFTALKDLRIRQWVQRQQTYPRAIFIRSGFATMNDIVRATGKNVCEVSGSGCFVLRIPLVITQDAVLYIGPEVKELRLSREGGAFLINSGRLFCLHTRVIGWSEDADSPALYRDEDEFRPFITAFGGSETYFVDSLFASLGYHQSKSYGITISQYSITDAASLYSPPTGWIINCRFTDIYYGFYCYEAEDFVIIGSIYYDNIVYGIDPHDRSRRLIIAENTIYGSRKKHGIIISREVNDSWIFRNHCHHNHRSGIVLDRNCRRVVVAANIVDHNGGDGITVYESHNDSFWGNVVFANQEQGIRFRNATDMAFYNNLVMENKRYGIYGHVADLSGTGRNLELDPYEQKLSFTLIGGRLEANGRGPLYTDDPEYVAIGRVSMLTPGKPNGIQFAGFLNRYQETLLKALSHHHMVVIESAGS